MSNNDKEKRATWFIVFVFESAMKTTIHFRIEVQLISE